MESVISWVTQQVTNFRGKRLVLTAAFPWQEAHQAQLEILLSQHLALVCLPLVPATMSCKKNKIKFRKSKVLILWYFYLTFFLLPRGKHVTCWCTYSADSLCQHVTCSEKSLSRKQVLKSWELSSMLLKNSLVSSWPSCALLMQHLLLGPPSVEEMLEVNPKFQ